jgi:hypothetical protein
MSYEEEDTCHMRRRIQTSVYLVLCISRHTISSCVSIDTDLLLAESEGGILHLKHNFEEEDTRHMRRRIPAACGVGGRYLASEA